jgi:hypothetical protein
MGMECPAGPDRSSSAAALALALKIALRAGETAELRQARRAVNIACQTAGSIDIFIESGDKTVLHFHDDADGPCAANPIAATRYLQMTLQESTWNTYPVYIGDVALRKPGDERLPSRTRLFETQGNAIEVVPDAYLGRAAGSCAGEITSRKGVKQLVERAGSATHISSIHRDLSFDSGGQLTFSGGFFA